LESTDVLASVLYEHLDRVVELYVYNSISDVVRVVGLFPTYNWPNGTGLLGAEVGTGYLHRLPKSCQQTIGHSIERKVNVVDANNDSLDEDNVQLEPHLEMEVVEENEQYNSDQNNHGSGTVGGETLYGRNNGDDDDHIGLAAPRRTKQPHELGRPVVATSSPSKSSIPPKQQNQPQSHNVSAVPSASAGRDGEINASTSIPSSAATIPAAANVVLPTDPAASPLLLAGNGNSIPQPPPILQPARVPTIQSNDAEALFSGPPPTHHNVASPNTSGMFSPPLPPVMGGGTSGVDPPQGSAFVQANDSSVKGNSQHEQSNEDGDDQESDEQDTDDEEEYTDDEEEEEQDEKPRSATGFIRSFMPAPPKMNY
jgi:hypothetical protein